MNSYQTPSLTDVKMLSNYVRLQGTGTEPTDGGGDPLTPITCEGETPSGCQLFGPVIDTNCNSIGNASYNINAFIPDASCDILTECSVTINGQNASSFCSQSFGVDGSTECDGGCAVQWDCFSSGSCVIGTVEISCPGYETCDTTVHTPT
jgi:hypothetical protein